MMKSVRERMAKEDEGFTLIELLVVMIIIGILAAIAIPIFLSQREKAQDTAAKGDVSTLGKEVATYFVDNTDVTNLSIDGGTGRYVMSGDGLSADQDLGKVSANVELTSESYADDTNWCIGVTNDQGDKQTWAYSAQSGLAYGTCAAGGVLTPGS